MVVLVGSFFSINFSGTQACEIVSPTFKFLYTIVPRISYLVSSLIIKMALPTFFILKDFVFIFITSAFMSA